MKNKKEFEINEDRVFVKYYGEDEMVIIPDGVKEIGDNAFDNCRNLKSVTIPDSVTRIGESAFFHCKSLTSIQIPESVKTIEHSAFKLCENLTSIEIPNHTAIGDEAFNHCNKLANENGFIVIRNILYGYTGKEYNIQIPENVKRIGNRAFEDCSYLLSVTIPDTVTQIGSFAFENCDHLRSVNIPDNVEVESAPFIECKKLADENGFIIINNVLYGYEGSEMEIKIPDGVTTIGRLAFFDCFDLKSVMIPDSVTFISTIAFSHCNNLTSITMRSTIHVERDAFWHCDHLKVTFK